MALRFGTLGTAILGLFLISAQDTSQHPTLAEQAGLKSLELSLVRFAAWKVNQPSDFRRVVTKLSPGTSIVGAIYWHTGKRRPPKGRTNPNVVISACYGGGSVRFR